MRTVIQSEAYDAIAAAAIFGRLLDELTPDQSASTEWGEFVDLFLEAEERQSMPSFSAVLAAVDVWRARTSSRGGGSPSAPPTFREPASSGEPGVRDEAGA